MCLIVFLGSHDLELFESRSAEHVLRQKTVNEGEVEKACVFQADPTGVGIEYPDGQTTWVDPQGVSIALCSDSEVHEDATPNASPRDRDF